jgi:hypothetical protein
LHFSQIGFTDGLTFTTSHLDDHFGGSVAVRPGPEAMGRRRNCSGHCYLYR